MLEAVVTILAVVPLNNLVLSLIKYLSEERSKVWLRGALALSSLVGVVAGAALNGDAVNFNQVNELVATVIVAGVAAVASHFNYTISKGA